MTKYAIFINKVKIKGQRKRYAWYVDYMDEEGYGFLFLECGDSFYIFNARRAAERAARRHAAGNTTITEADHYEITV